MNSQDVILKDGFLKSLYRIRPTNFYKDLFYNSLKNKVKNINNEPIGIIVDETGMEAPSKYNSSYHDPIYFTILIGLFKPDYLIFYILTHHNKSNGSTSVYTINLQENNQEISPTFNLEKIDTQYCLKILKEYYVGGMFSPEALVHVANYIKTLMVLKTSDTLSDKARDVFGGIDNL